MYYAYDYFCVYSEYYTYNHFCAYLYERHWVDRGYGRIDTYHRYDYGALIVEGPEQVDIEKRDVQIRGDENTGFITDSADVVGKYHSSYVYERFAYTCSRSHPSLGAAEDSILGRCRRLATRSS